MVTIAVERTDGSRQFVSVADELEKKFVLQHANFDDMFVSARTADRLPDMPGASSSMAMVFRCAGRWSP